MAAHRKKKPISGRHRRGTSAGFISALNVGRDADHLHSLLALLNAMMGGITTGRTWPGSRKACKLSSAGSSHQLRGHRRALARSGKIGNCSGRVGHNEFVALASLVLRRARSIRARLPIATFALCASPTQFHRTRSADRALGAGAAQPTRRFGIGLLAGTMANLMSASIVGIFS